uniref:Cell cycle checkpoint control protein RAD9A n=1 Tax=Triatoma infestans TaxID=30076 RepID=A0A023F055_TRIIF
MKCIIPNQNVKILARAIHSLSKIGDEMFIEPTCEEMTFRTVNMAQSAFAEFKMSQCFFSSFIFSDPGDCDSLCKVTMRSCINVFKNLHNLDKQVENCEIRMKPDATVVIFQMKFTNAPIKKYYLPIIESEKLEANIPKEPLNRVTASSKMLMSTVKNFRYTEDEITFTVEKDKTYIKNHIEIKKDTHSMRTELCFHPSEFETYTVFHPTCVTFCFKELRAVLSFAEPSNLSVTISFSSPGMPILFQVPNHPAYEANYVVSTLNANTANLEMNLTRQSRTTNHQQPSEALNASQQLRPTVYSFIDETEPYDIQQNLIVEESLPQTANVNVLETSARSSNIKGNQEQLVVNKSTSVTTYNRKRKNSDADDSLSLSDGIVSVYSTFNTNMFNKKSRTFAVDKTDPTSSSNEAIDKEDSSELIKIVFARCFKNANVLEKISGNEIVIADSSNSESV